MHFELRWYADGASNLLIEVWDSSASVISIMLHIMTKNGASNLLIEVWDSSASAISIM